MKRNNSSHLRIPDKEYETPVVKFSYNIASRIVDAVLLSSLIYPNVSILEKFGEQLKDN